MYHKIQINHRLGFTLVELIVSMSMAGALMLGLSVFFASTFHNLFLAQSQNAANARQFAVNQILDEKFAEMDKLVSPTSIDDGNKTGPFLVFNKKNSGQLPFTLIGVKDAGLKNYLAFKDLMVINKILKSGSDYYYGDRQNTGGVMKGVIKKTGSEDTEEIEDPYFAGFDKMDECFFMAEPNKNRIKGYGSLCPDLDFGQTTLDSPMDVAISDDKNWLFISDSGNNRILKYDLQNNRFPASENETIVVKTGLSFPTGLAYYKKTVDATPYEFLFVSDTFNNQVKRINLLNGKTEIMAGDGETRNCDGAGTARFCKLNMPTGLFVDTTANALYIADSGNNRVLKMTDPGKPTTLNLVFGLADPFALDKIELVGNWSGGDLASGNLISDGDWFEDKTYKAKNQFTTFSDNLMGCVSKGQNLFINEPASYLKFGDRLKIGESVVTVSSYDGQKICEIPGETPIYAYPYLILLADALPADQPTGIPVYPSNPDSVEIGLNNVNWSGTGFQSTTIKTYDLQGGLVDTDYMTTRVGDGVLGTSEDQISVVAMPPRIGQDFFPTGISDAFVADTTNRMLVSYLRADDGNDKALGEFVRDFSNFVPDYISDFAIESMEFGQPTGTSLLEMDLTVLRSPDDPASTMTYTHTAILTP